MTENNIKTDSGREKNLIAKPKITATKKFIPGPAIETLSVPHFWSRKLKGLIGTGFAQPTIKGLPEKIKIKGKTMVPKRSMCFNGFKVKRPASFAVGSPKCRATDPWAISCKTIEKNKTTKENIVSIVSLWYHIFI